MRLARDGLCAMDIGAWAENKHYYLNRYCHMFAVGTRKKWPRRYYIDLFSGPGIGVNRETGLESPGSPLIALAHPFTNYVFVEESAESIEALKVRTRPLLNGRNVEYILGDANSIFSDIVRNVRQQGSLSLIFADPYTIQLKMRTIEWFSENFRADLLINFPYGTFLQRVIPQMLTEMTEGTLIELNEFYGSTEWQELRGHKPNPRVYLDLYEAKLRELGYMIGDNYPRMVNVKNATLYYLVLASKNRLALKFWESTNEIDPDGQRVLF